MTETLTYLLIPQQLGGGATGTKKRVVGIEGADQYKDTEKATKGRKGKSGYGDQSRNISKEWLSIRAKEGELRKRPAKVGERRTQVLAVAGARCGFKLWQTKEEREAF